MEITGIDHISIVVRDRERSLDFYGRILGFPQLPTVDLGDHVLRYFRVPDGRRIELNEYTYPTGTARDLPNDKGKFRHLAFAVRDIGQWEKRLAAEGYPFIHPVSYSPALGVYSGLVLDPNGVELEFVEYPETGGRP